MAQDDPEPAPELEKRSPTKVSTVAKKFWDFGLVVALAAIGSATYLIKTGAVCGIDEVGKSFLKGIKPCDASAQLSMALKTKNATEVREVIDVLAADSAGATEALQALLHARQAVYLDVLAKSGLDPTHLEASLKGAGFYSTRSKAMATDFADIVRHAVGAERAGQELPPTRRLLSTTDFRSARDKVKAIPLLAQLRDEAEEKSGPFVPLGLELTASQPGEGYPGACEVFVRDASLHGRVLRIEGHGDGVIVRRGRNAIPDEIRGEAVTIDLQVNPDDAKALHFPRLSKIQDTVFVREANREDQRLFDPTCGE